MFKPKTSIIRSIFISALFWLFPLLALISSNLGQIQLNSSVRLILISIVVSIVITLITSKLFQSWDKGLLFSCLLALLFTTYGHIYFEIEKISIGSFVIGRHRYLILLYIALLIVGSYLIFRIKVVRQNRINILIPVACVFVIIPGFQIASYLVQQSANTPYENTKATVKPISRDDQLPDIYLFVLDGYGRSDLLKKDFAYDNSEFLNLLSDEGFYLATCSQSNYTSTWFSIASMLNMNYLEAMSPLNGETRTVLTMVPYIKHSIVRKELESKGYTTVAFETGFGFTEITDSDVYFQPANANLIRILTGRMNAFELFYLRTTIVSAWMDLTGISADDIEKSIKLTRQDYIYSALQNEVIKIKSPKFVFAHILTTHKPFVYYQRSFDQDPVVSQLDADFRGYHDTLVYSDKMMSQIIQKIILSSKVPPIIIVTGDHGPPVALESRQQRAQNIYAIYLGGRKSDQLHPTMTPVNSFRIVFDSVFNEQYPILPDKSFAGEDRNKLIQIENPCTSQ